MKHSQKKLVDQHQKYRKTLKTYFDSLKVSKDIDYIQIDDLEDPFITLGLAKTRQEVRDIVSLYDDNGNGRIEFEEFLDILDGRLHTATNSNFGQKRTSFQEFFRSKYKKSLVYQKLISVVRLIRWKTKRI
jgi:Ca2+-binding EF-hand superfamily protein